LGPAKESISVWPGYVAAVASLVMSLLLLAGVLVVAITQVGGMVDSYNQQLMAAAQEDERRSLEMQAISARAPPKQKTAAVQQKVIARKPTQVVSAEQTASSRALELQEMKELQALEEQWRKRSEEVAALKSELTRVQDDLRAVGEPVAGDTTRFYRFLFGPGVQGLDDRVVEQLRARMRADGVSPAGSNWTLEAGVSGVDVVASREVYRILLKVRGELERVGFAADQIRIVMNRDVAPQELPGSRSVLRPGDTPILLRPADARGGGR
jgi:hypothetical protein